MACPEFKNTESQNISTSLQLSLQNVSTQPQINIQSCAPNRIVY